MSAFIFECNKFQIYRSFCSYSSRNIKSLLVASKVKISQSKSNNNNVANLTKCFCFSFFRFVRLNRNHQIFFRKKFINSIMSHVSAFVAIVFGSQFVDYPFQNWNSLNEIFINLSVDVLHVKHFFYRFEVQSGKQNIYFSIGIASSCLHSSMLFCFISFSLFYSLIMKFVSFAEAICDIKTQCSHFIYLLFLDRTLLIRNYENKISIN